MGHPPLPVSQDPDKLYGAQTPWRKLWFDLALLFLGGLWMLVSYAMDYKAAHEDWFSKSGAIAVLLSGVLAYRSLTKHYQKFFNDTLRGYPLKTSPNQSIVDRVTLVLAILGTLVWGYGEKLFGFAAEFRR